MQADRLTRSGDRPARGVPARPRRGRARRSCPRRCRPLWAPLARRAPAALTTPIRSARRALPLRSGRARAKCRADPDRRPPRLRRAGRGAGDGDREVGSRGARGPRPSRFRDANHLGRLGAYTERIASAGLVGILLANDGGATSKWPPSAPPAPLHEQPHVDRGAGPAVLDVALSAAVEGGVYRPTNAARPLPRWIPRLGRALPAQIPRPICRVGPCCPVGDTDGGHKGYGLIVLVELLVGLLTLGGICGPERRAHLQRVRPGVRRDRARTAATSTGAAARLHRMGQERSATRRAGADPDAGAARSRHRAATTRIDLDEPTMCAALTQLGRAAGLAEPL